MKPWAKVPRFSERPWERCSPRTSKTVRGTRAERGPRTCIAPKVPRRNVEPFHYTLVLLVYPCSENVEHWEYCFPMSHVFTNWGTLKNSTSNVPCFMNNPGKCPVLLSRVKSAKPGYNELCRHECQSPNPV